MKNKTPFMSRLATLWFLGICSLLLLGPLPVRATVPLQSEAKLALERIRAEHQHVLNNLNAKSEEGKVMDLGDPRVPGLVKKGWRLAGKWAATYIETHPSASKADLERIFEGFAPEPRGVKSQHGDFLEYEDYGFAGSAIRVGPSVYVVEARYIGVDFPTGTFMVVARNVNGHFQALWNIKDLAEKRYPQRDEIGRWLHLVRRAYYNGPLDVANVIPLPPAANGRSRFLVNAYQGADGGTIFAQLSIWEWAGAEAKPLLVEIYYFAADYAGFHFDGRALRIITKEELQTVFSCGSCPEPRGVWTVRITPTGVQNLGHRFLQPQLKWADELLSKIDQGEDTTGLAEAKVVEALKARMAELRSETGTAPLDQAKTAFSWGMRGKCRVIRSGQRGAFVLALDEAELRFSYLLRHGKPYFTNVRIK